MLEKNFTKNVPSAFLDYFAKADSPLSRVQIIALVLALDSTGELRYALCSSWFKTAPDPQAVVDLLALSSNTQNFEAFSVEAARFLANHTWEANINQLSQIANHKEALARALAYSKLDPSIPAEREVLRKRVGLEPVERLKSELKQRMLENE